MTSKMRDLRRSRRNTKVPSKRPRLPYIALAVLALVVGAGVVVYNYDSMYLSDHPDLALSFQEGSFVENHNASFVVVVSDNEGELLRDKEVEVKLKTSVGTQKESGVTDSNGVFIPTVRVPDFNGTATLIVKSDESTLERNVKVVSEDDSQAKVGGLRILLTTDKPIYHPTWEEDDPQNIRVRAVVFQGDGLYEGQISLDVQGPNGEVLMRQSATTNEWGIANWSFLITDQHELGTYTLIAKASNREARSTVQVKEYVLPKFKIEFEGINSWYTVGSTIKGSISCQYFFGKPVQGSVRVQAYDYIGVEVIRYDQQFTLDMLGQVPIEIPMSSYSIGIPVNQDNGIMRLNISVTDTSGHTESKLLTLTVARSPIIISALTDTNIVGLESNYYIITQSPDGTMIEGVDIKATVGALIMNERTDERGLAKLNFTYQSGMNSMEVTASKDGASSSETFSASASKGLKIVPSQHVFTMGDEAKFTIYYSGESYTRIVYYDVINSGNPVTNGIALLEDDKAELVLPVSDVWVGSTIVRAFKIQSDESVVKDSTALTISPQAGLEVAVTPSEGIYNPYESVHLDFAVTEEGEPAMAALGLSIVDESVFELSGRLGGGFEDLYFALEDKALEPSYQIWDYVFSSGNSMPLPEKKEVPLSNPDYTSGAVLEVSSNSRANTAIAAREMDDLVANYWAAIIGISVIAFLGAMVYSIHKRSGLAGVLIAVAIGAMLLCTGLMFVWTTSLSDTSEDAEKGGDIAWDMGDEWREEENLGWEDEWGDGGDWGWEDEEAMAPPDDDDDNDGISGSWEMMYGLDPLDDSPTEYNEGAKTTPKDSRVAPARTREFFPETWLWQPFLMTDDQGRASLDLVAPDSITNWKVEAVAHTDQAMMGVGIANVTVFQKFFIEPDLPEHVIRNDSFTLRVQVYNYDDTEHICQIRLENDDWFVLEDTLGEKKVTVPIDGVLNVTFRIRATTVGVHNVTIEGDNGVIADRVIRPMRVEPDGRQTGQIQNGRLGGNSSSGVLDVEFSPERIEGSEDAWIKLQGGMDAVILDGAEGFIQFVSGCGEQSLSTLSIDILAFDTVMGLDDVPAEKLFEYESIVTQGIQHELQYLENAKNGNGRGIVWFPDDEDVHPWLTSWGVITFQDAVDAGFALDSQIIPDMQEYLLSQQDTDGSFKFPDRGLYEFTNPILRAKVVSCTAYITRALLYSGYPGYSNEIQNAVRYLESHAMDDQDDPYTMALSLIAIEAADGSASVRAELSGRIFELRQGDDDGLVWWDSSTNMLYDNDYSYGRSNSNTIETTGYCLMALYASGGYTNAVNGGISYLMDNRERLGGWFSTQDTVVAFQTLKQVSRTTPGAIDVDVFINGAMIVSERFDDFNKDITRLIDLRPHLKMVPRIAQKNSVRIDTRGSGEVFYQVYSEEYLPWTSEPVEQLPIELTIEYDATEIEVNDLLKATINLKVDLGTGDVNATNITSSFIRMILIDLRAPVGFEFVETDFEYLTKEGIIDNYEINNRQAYMYLVDVPDKTEVVMVYHLRAISPIRATIQDQSAYDMYNPEVKSEVPPIIIEAQ